MAPSPSRRELLAGFLLAGGALALGTLPRRVLAQDHRPLRILVLGGTKMLGPAVINAALARGHSVAMFNRGRTEHELGTVIPDQVERLIGDRDPLVGDGLRALEGRTFDVVIDTSGLFPRMVEASATLLQKQGAHRYIFVSSISAYENHRTPNADESDTPAHPQNPEAEECDPGFVYTGELKRTCEQAVEKVFGARATIVRPSYLVGPGDVSGRFAYWPVRVSEAVGERTTVLVPGAPGDPVQVVDVRDLGAWLVLLAERDTPGTFNVAGPSRPYTFGEVLSACEAAAGTKPKYEWVTWEFLVTQNQPMPIVLPAEGEYAGFHRRNGDKAIRAGFTARPLRDTCADILAWFHGQPGEQRFALRGGFSLEIEAELLAAWKASHAEPNR